MTYVNTTDPESSLSDHVGDMHRMTRVWAICMCMLCIFWSIFAGNIISSWLDLLMIQTGPNNENMSVYAPFDWIQMRWEIVIMLSLVSLLPLISIQLYRFSRLGLYPRERNWLISVLVLSTTIVPLAILYVWIYGIPAIFAISSEVGYPESVGVRYDAAAVFSIAIGVSWVMVVWSVTVVSLTMTRFFGLVSNGVSRFRHRFMAVSAGTLILTLPVEFDGLRLLIAIVTVLFADYLSSSLPVTMPDWDQRGLNDVTT